MSEQGSQNDMTEPLTPADCDLRDYPWMPLDCTRLLTSETWILGSADEKVAALTLWCKSWHQVPAGSLPDSDRMLAALSEAGGKWLKVREHAMRGWIKCSDGRLYHPVVCGKAYEAWQMKLARKSRTEAARAAKADRRSNLSAPPQTLVTESVTEVVTGSTGQDRTRQDKTGQYQEEEREEGTLSDPRVAGAERAAPEAHAEPSWPPKPHPSAITSRVEQVAIRLKGNARGQPFLTARGPVRSVNEQMAAVAPKRQAKPVPAEVLEQAWAKLRGAG